MGFIPRLQGDLQDRAFRAPQLPRAPLQPQAPHMLPHRFAHHAPENPVEMKRREARHLRQFLQRQGAVQVLLDVRQHLRDALAIGVHGTGLHEIESSLSGRAFLDRFCGKTPGVWLDSSKYPARSLYRAAHRLALRRVGSPFGQFPWVGHMNSKISCLAVPAALVP